MDDKEAMVGNKGKEEKSIRQKLEIVKNEKKQLLGTRERRKKAPDRKMKRINRYHVGPGQTLEIGKVNT